MILELPQYETKKEMFDFLVANKTTLINQKKSAIKFADAISLNVIPQNLHSTTKAYDNREEEEEDKDFVEVKAVINTTGILDGHGDVHIKGLWNKSLKENKRLLHVQEHKTAEFDKIISSGEDLKAYVKDFSWKELGYEGEGETQALVFESKVRRERNAKMFEAYSKGYVTNHSVGMQYVKLELAINDEEYEKEMNFWNKYIDQVVNRKDAEDAGYFWVVTEAKAIEGSAVPLGSNPITPTMSIKNEPIDLIDAINKSTLGTEKAAESTFNLNTEIDKLIFNL